MDPVLQKIVGTYKSKSTKKSKRGDQPKLYSRIYSLLKNAIINNDIPAGNQLPATRVLATELHVSRTTVLRAYELLVLEGYIESKTGSGHVVKPINADPPKLDPPEEYEYPEISETGRSFLANIPLINSTDDKSLAFRPGLPPLDIFPVNKWKNLSNLYWRYIKLSALTYSPSSGIDQLKKNIANYLNLSRDIKCDPRQVIIVSGSLQSLYLSGTAIVNPGDRVVMEDPTFPNVISIFKGLRASIATVPTDQYGLQVNELNTNKYAKAKVIHTTPSGHYPTGVVMSLKRRKELLSWASANRVFIIENDFEHEISNSKKSTPALFSLDKEQRTIYLSTFNRLIHPSIRVGYMVVPNYLLDTVEALQKHSHRFVPPAIQIVLNQFIEKAYLYKHVNNVISTAKKRKQIFQDAWQRHFGDRVKLVNQRYESLHLLAEFSADVSDKDVVDTFMQENVITHAYSKCFVHKPRKQGLIMGYSSVRESVIARKVELMAQLYKNKYG